MTTRRFGIGDNVRITRILACSLSRINDLHLLTFENYHTFIHKTGTIISSALHDNGKFTYLVKTDSTSLWFHEEELDFD